MKTNKNEEGFILVITMLILVILTLVGLSVVRTSKVEIEVAGSEKWATRSFFRGDGSTSVATAVVEAGIYQKLRDGKKDYAGVYLSTARIDMQEKPSDADISWIKLGESIPTGGSAPHYIIVPQSKVKSNKIEGIPVTMVQVGKEFRQSGGSKNKNDAWTNLSMATGYGQKNSSSSLVYYNYWVKDIGEMNSESLLQEKYRLKIRF